MHWGGDSSASYISMAETLRGGLSFAMSGFSFWSHDIGGFENTAPADVYKRWLAFGLLSSHSRLHGSGSYRVPWAFDEQACDVARYFVQLKCSLMPYLYAKAVEAHEDGTPVMRPMVFEFEDDPACQTLDMQYMLGEKSADSTDLFGGWQRSLVSAGGHVDKLSGRHSQRGRKVLQGQI